jgi:hypothetical protein
MKYFYLYIFLLLCFIIAVSFFNTYKNTYKENFNSTKQSFILLGDSILRNDTYVSDGRSVNELLKERTNDKSICLAINDSKIVDIYSQIEKIPENLNTNYTTIFLSVGGNDILSNYVNNNETNDDTNLVLIKIFSEYKSLIKSIKQKLPDANIVLLDIYYPDNIKYKQYHSIINKWNNMIYNYASKNKYSVLKISGVLTSSDDFTFDIEPSASGSRKLVETILLNY